MSACPRRSRSRIAGTAYAPVAAGSPGPFERNTPSGLWARISSPVAVAGSTVTRQPWSASSRRMLRLISKTTNEAGVEGDDHVLLQWRGTACEWLGVAASLAYLGRGFDRVFVPGERQRQFARRLGFSADEIDLGFYSADAAAFTAAECRDEARRAFVFVGRLVQDKGIDVLIDAVPPADRTRVSDPFDLIVAGTGPKSAGLAGIPGVQACGFVPPTELPSVIQRVVRGRSAEFVRSLGRRGPRGDVRRSGGDHHRLCRCR